VDIKKKRQVPNGQGNAASMDNGDFVSRSCSWQSGADVSSDAIDAESQEEDMKFGVPSDIATGDGMKGAS
jgi:hypothetical protein